MASQFGWAAVSNEPMAHYDLLLAVQLMSEERVGHAMRESARSQAAQEDAAKRRTLRVVGG